MLWTTINDVSYNLRNNKFKIIFFVKLEVLVNEIRNLRIQYEFVHQRFPYCLV